MARVFTPKFYICSPDPGMLRVLIKRRLSGDPVLFISAGSVTGFIWYEWDETKD